MPDHFYVISEDEGYEALAYCRTLEDFKRWAVEYAAEWEYAPPMFVSKDGLEFAMFRFPNEDTNLIAYATKTTFYGERI